MGMLMWAVADHGNLSETRLTDAISGGVLKFCMISNWALINKRLKILMHNFRTPPFTEVSLERLLNRYFSGVELRHNRYKHHSGTMQEALFGIGRRPA
jgi:hypothetical protein